MFFALSVFLTAVFLFDIKKAGFIRPAGTFLIMQLSNSREKLVEGWQQSHSSILL